MKKVIDKQAQDLAKLYALNRKKKLILKEKQNRGKDQLSKIASGFEEILEFKRDFKDNLEEESGNQKIGLEEEQETLQVLTASPGSRCRV